MLAIEKCAAILINDKRLLVVRKLGTDTFISPGGKIEISETHTECLSRELKEELGVDLQDIKFFGTYCNPSAFENTEIIIHTYSCNVMGDFLAQAEIEEIAWVGGRITSPHIKIGSVFSEHVIPELISKELIDD